MPFDKINADDIRTLPLRERRSEIDIRSAAIDPGQPAPNPGALGPQLDRLAQRMAQARSRGSAVILVYGAHVIKNGCGRLIAALVGDGYLTHLATQGAGIIHDWEFAYLGRSSESVRDNAPRGEFGAWDETGRWINLAAAVGAAEGLGLGESVCRLVGEDGLTLPDPEVLAQQVRHEPGHELAGARADLLWFIRHFKLGAGRQEVRHPYKRYSVLDACHRHQVPLTVHPGIGYDIFTNHAMFHGGALGRGAGTDARIFTRSVMNLSGGVLLSISSAIMSPQVFEKALSVANNLLHQEGTSVRGHYLAVVDLQDGGGWDWSRGEPPRDTLAYYLRFCKTFHRMGGTLDYLCGDNRLVLANLLARLGRGRDLGPACPTPERI